jgi:tetratricopeptide (TPR) repeat protein
MTVQDQQDDIGDDTNGSGGSSFGAGVRNVVGAAMSGMVVQAGTLVAGDTHHHHPSAASGRPVPRQLPAVPPAFVGRAGELAELAITAGQAAAVGGTAVISAIGGAGGIGKTALALHWAHRHADRFPDGQMFVDLRGFSPAGEPMTPAEAVRGFLDALGVDPARIPTDLHAQAGLYRSLVTGRRMLIVLDNAADAQQLVPLLPSAPSCEVLVTSRRRLDSLVTNHGAHPVHLGVLTDTEARQLLATRLGADRVDADPEAVAALLAVCGGYPMALAIVAGRARTHPHLPLATLVTELRDEAAGLDVLDSDDPAASLPTVLSWSLRALTPRQRTVFGLLGIAPGPDIGLAAAASLIGVPAAQARVVLRGLVQASLLGEDAPGRWRMHDLIRRYAVDQVARDRIAPDHGAALLRVVDFYLHSAEAASKQLSPPLYAPMVPFGQPADGCTPQAPGDASAALAWFRAEYRNLLDAERAAAEQVSDAHAWQMAWAMQNFRIMRGHHGDNVAAWRAALVVADRLPGPMIPAWTQGLLGVALVWGRQPVEATRHLRPLLDAARHLDDVRVEPHVHFLLAWAYDEGGDYERAGEHASHSLRLCRELGLGLGEAYALHVVGRCRMRAGDLDGARACCEEALALHRAQGDHFGEAEMLDNLGEVARLTGSPGVIEYYHQALDLYRVHGFSYAEANCLDRLGRAHLTDGRHDEARTTWREALDLYREQARDADAGRVQRQLDALGVLGNDEPPRNSVVRP